MAFYSYRKASPNRVTVIITLLSICGFIVMGDQIRHPGNTFYEISEGEALRAVGGLAIIITLIILTLALRAEDKKPDRNAE